MSQENVDLVREHIEAFRQDDVPSTLSSAVPFLSVELFKALTRTHARATADRGP